MYTLDINPSNYTGSTETVTVVGRSFYMYGYRFTLEAAEPMPSAFAPNGHLVRLTGSGWDDTLTEFFTEQPDDTIRLVHRAVVWIGNHV